MADRIEFSCQATPIETLDQDSDVDGPDVLASETFGSMFGSGTVTTWTQITATSGSTYGYENGTVYYLNTAAASTNPAALPSAAPITFLYIKNTGYLYSSATALGGSTTDYITVRALKSDEGDLTTTSGSIAAGEEPLIACLEPGAAIMLPMAAGLAINANYYGVHSTTSNGTTAGAGIVAMELFIGK